MRVTLLGSALDGPWPDPWCGCPACRDAVTCGVRRDRASLLLGARTVLDLPATPWHAGLCGVTDVVLTGPSGPPSVLTLPARVRVHRPRPGDELILDCGPLLTLPGGTHGGVALLLPEQGLLWAPHGVAGELPVPVRTAILGGLPAGADETSAATGGTSPSVPVADRSRSGSPSPDGQPPHLPRSEGPTGDVPPSGGPVFNEPVPTGPRSDGPTSADPLSDGTLSIGHPSEGQPSEGQPSDRPLPAGHPSAGQLSDGPLSIGNLSDGQLPEGPASGQSMTAGPRPDLPEQAAQPFGGVVPGLLAGGSAALKGQASSRSDVGPSQVTVPHLSEKLRDADLVSLTRHGAAAAPGRVPEDGTVLRGRRLVLVTGGTRSGKSRYAERLLAPVPDVTYLASGPTPGPDDDEWAARVQAHRDRRPATWGTVETTDVAATLRAADHPVLWDCVGTWLTAQLDAAGAWEQTPGWRDQVDARIDTLLAAWRLAGTTVVAVTNEVGSAVVPATASGRLFTDLLGRVNTALADEADEVVLVVAGRAVRL